MYPTSAQRQKQNLLRIREHLIWITSDVRERERICGAASPSHVRFILSDGRQWRQRLRRSCASLHHHQTPSFAFIVLIERPRGDKLHTGTTLSTISGSFLQVTVRCGPLVSPDSVTSAIDGFNKLCNISDCHVPFTPSELTVNHPLFISVKVQSCSTPPCPPLMYSGSCQGGGEGGFGESNLKGLNERGSQK